jgi:hypothetical protein
VLAIKERSARGAESGCAALASVTLDALLAPTFRTPVLRFWGFLFLRQVLRGPMRDLPAKQRLLVALKIRFRPQ